MNQVLKLWIKDKSITELKKKNAGRLREHRDLKPCLLVVAIILRNYFKKCSSKELDSNNIQEAKWFSMA